MNIVSHECHSYCEICGKDLSERIKVLENDLIFFRNKCDEIEEDDYCQADRLKVLEEAVKDWHKIADQRSEEIIKQFERIKVLEDALRQVLVHYSHNYGLVL